jgi:hypothetical protein
VHTLLALAIRLADHLVACLSSSNFSATFTADAAPQARADA